MSPRKTGRFMPFFFFFNDTPTTEIYTLSLHDALPIYLVAERRPARKAARHVHDVGVEIDRKSTRLNCSHVKRSYAVFCLKKKKNTLDSIQERSSKAIPRRSRRHLAGW